ncbi:hypothetical protein [Labilibacter marinus]|uniref:hypothetical protein n=1 Tax=Labilibacter marinus TaxID=1477105 RepID=UPI00094FAC52|nr:hypothetical protein [Labilibacter marinus]
MKKDFSKFKVLGITLLVTMSSCVGGSLELNAETLRNYGFELDIHAADRLQTVGKQKKSKSNSKFKINKLIESGRAQVATSAYSIDYVPIVFYLRYQHYLSPCINPNIKAGELLFSSTYQGINFQNRAGPLSC